MSRPYNKLLEWNSDKNMYDSIVIHSLLYIFQIRHDIRSKLAGFVDRIFYVDQYPEFSAIVSVVPDGLGEEVSFLFLVCAIHIY